MMKPTSLFLSALCLLVASINVYALGVTIPLSGNGVIPKNTPPSINNEAVIESSHFAYNTSYTLLCNLTNNSSENISVSVYEPNLEEVYSSITFRGKTMPIQNLQNSITLPNGTYALTVNGFHLARNSKGTGWGLLAIENLSKNNSITVSGCVANTYEK